MKITLTQVVVSEAQLKMFLADISRKSPEHDDQVNAAVWWITVVVTDGLSMNIVVDDVVQVINSLGQTH